MTTLFLERPWLVALLWLVLHPADYWLTIYGASLARRVAQIKHESYELNPLFRKDVAELRWLAPRFVVSLFAMAILLPAVFALIAMLGPTAQPVLGPIGGVETLIGLVLGVLVFTRLVVIATHLSNIWMFRRILGNPLVAHGQTRYAHGLMLELSAMRWGAFAGTLAVAALVSPHPWLAGGALGCALLTLKHAVLAARQPAPAPATLPPS